MSGRKSSEVSSLLSLGKKSKDEINRNLNNTFYQNIEKNKYLFSSLEDIEREIKDISLQIDSQIKDEISINELNVILNRLKAEKEKILNTKLDDFSEELKKKKLIEDEFLSLERITTELERNITNKSHYCDEEYSEANSVVKRYEEGKKQLNLLLSKILNKMQKNNEIFLNTKITYQNIKKIKEEFALKTKNIINANNMALIQDMFKNIDENIAKKFMSSEFTDLQKEYKTLNQDNIESKFSVFKQKLEVFSQELLEKYNTYIFKKERAEKTEGTEKEKKAPSKVSKAARTKKINKQIEGLDLIKKITSQLLKVGLSTMGTVSLKEYKDIVKQLGDYYLPGPQILFQRLMLEVQQYKEDQDTKHYQQALDCLKKLRAIEKKGREYLKAELK